MHCPSKAVTFGMDQQVRLRKAVGPGAGCESAGLAFHSARIRQARHISRKHPCRLSITAALSDKRTHADYPTGKVYKSAVSIKKVAEVRGELARLQADTTGTKAEMVERLFELYQKEAAEMQAAQQRKVEKPPPPPPERPQRPTRTLAEMGAKLSLRSTSATATQAQRAARLTRSRPPPRPDLTAAQDKPIVPEPQPHLPGYSAAQAVRKILISRIAQAKQKQPSDTLQPLPHKQQRQQQQQQQQRQQPSDAVQSQQLPQEQQEQPEPSVLQAQQASSDQAATAADHVSSVEHGQDSAASATQAVSRPSQQQVPQDSRPEQAGEHESVEQSPAQQPLAQQPPAPQPLPEEPLSPQSLSQPPVTDQHETDAAQREYDPWFDDPDYEPDESQQLAASANAELPQVAERQRSHALASISGSSSNGSVNGSSSNGSSSMNSGSSSSSISGSRSRSKSRSSSSFDSSSMWRAGEEEQEVVNSNATGMQISFLGTAGKQGCKTRSPNCLAIRTQQAVMMFNCGEDVQRQLMAQPQIAHGRINRIFVTDLSSANIHGIPGMLCTLSWSREKGSEDISIPVHIYGPPGLAKYVKDVLLLSDTRFMIPILVHEFCTEPCSTAPERLTVASKRCRMYRVTLPPDQLNREGYYDGVLSADFLKENKRSNKRIDLRASTKQITLPPPGNPQQQDVSFQEMSWTINCDNETVVTAFPLQKDPVTLSAWETQHQQLGYTLQEADRAGHLDVVKAQALGVPPGRAYGALKAGEPVQTTDGSWVQPEQVVEPDHPGRRICILGGHTSQLAAALPWAQNADTLILNADLEEQDDSEQAAAAGTAIAHLAAAAKAGQVLLTKLSDNNPNTNELVRRISTACEESNISTTVVPAYDHMVLCLERR